MRSLVMVFAMASLFAGAPSLAQDVGYDAKSVLATVDGDEITLGHVIAMQQRLPQQFQDLPDEALFDGVLDQLIEQTLLAKTLSKSPEGDPLSVRLLMENERRGTLAAMVVQDRIAGPVNEAVLRGAYEESIEGFESQPEFSASHILVATEEEAAAILDELEAGGDFTQLAQEKSLDGSAAEGGSLGWFGLGRMVPEFEAAVADMEVGDVGRPVKTQFGWHLIRLDDMRQSEPPAFEEAREEIQMQWRQQQLQEEVEALRGSAAIEINEIEIPPSAVRENALLED